MNHQDVTLALAQNVASISYNDIQSEAIEITKNCILDTLGVTLAGGTLADGPRQIVELVKDWGGKQESTIIGFGGKVPCLMAAFANGAMSHALDYDDVLDTGFLHVGITVVPSAFAVSERLGNVSGKELITAITLGADLICRLGNSITQVPRKSIPPWLMTATLGTLSSAAACAKLLRLTEHEIASALGIALNQAAGTMEVAFNPRANLRTIYGGFPAEAGLKAALLAEKGIRGPDTALEGTAGLYNMYFDGKYNRAILFDQLGERFDNVKTSFKPWPSCRWTHTYIGAALDLVRKHDIHPEHVKSVIAYVGDTTQDLCHPLEERRLPQTSIAARFSIPFCLAVAISYRTVKLCHYTKEGLEDRRVLKLAEKISPHYDSRFNKWTFMPPARVEIETSGGEVYAEEMEIPYGNPSNPMTRDEFIDKFNDCLSYSPSLSIKKNGEKVVEMLDRLDELDNVAHLINLLT